MGKEIVRQESPNDPGRRSRLWFHDDIIYVLKENMGTRKTEIIHLSSPSTEAIEDWNEKAFKKMKNLKTLIIENVNFSKDEMYLPSCLRVLKWKGCTSESLSSSILYKKFENMKVFTLDHCQYLTHIPDVSGLPNLEKFSFQKCHNLITIDNSLGHLHKLKILNAKGCNKFESFPPLGLASLRDLELSECKSLKNFPELLCKMRNIEYIRLYETSIGELPFSFQNLSELYFLTIYQGGMFRISSNIFMMPKLSMISAKGCRILLPKQNEKNNSIVSSNVEHLDLQSNNLSDECFPIILKWCVNVTYLYLWNNNFKILPECFSECHLLRMLYLDDCKSLKEIKGIPPNLNYLSAVKCESLSSSSRRMILSQKLQEAGCTEILLPTGTEGIPDWFDHQIRGRTISFWFRKKIPSILSIIIFHKSDWVFPTVNLFVNGHKCRSGFSSPINFYLEGHTFLFDLKLEENIKHYNLVSKLDMEVLRNEWIHVELKLERIKHSRQMGIHMLKDKSSTEENVKFTNPYRKRKLDENLDTSISQVHALLKKQRSMNIEFSDIELDQHEQQHCIGMVRTASLLARLLTVSFVPLDFSFCLLVFSFLILFWRIPYLLFCL